MCGRFILTTCAANLVDHFKLTRNFVLKPRYNISPGEMVPIIRQPGFLEFVSWGLRPSWLHQDRAAFINARLETLHEKPAFRVALKGQRCLIVADGYYEWKQVGRIKQPYLVRFATEAVFAFAGLWDNDSCAIITKVCADENICNLHNRMPIILTQENYQIWLNPKTHMDTVHACMQNNLAQGLKCTPVSTKVNNPNCDFAECIEPLQ